MAALSSTPLLVAQGYSCADLFELCREASNARLRELRLWERSAAELAALPLAAVRSIEARDFAAALPVIRPSVPPASALYSPAACRRADRGHPGRGCTQARTANYQVQFSADGRYIISG